MPDVILDVRERDEFKSEHVENSINVPLSELKIAAPGVLANLSGRKVVLMCLSGKRAGIARDQIQALGIGTQCNLEIYEGGLSGWKRAGRPTVIFKRGHIPLMRQVLLTAGSLELAFLGLGSFQSPVWYLGAAFVGAGLMFAGATGICPMAELLSRMPWNRGVMGDSGEQCLKG